MNGTQAVGVLILGSALALPLDWPSVELPTMELVCDPLSKDLFLFSTIASTADLIKAKSLAPLTKSFRSRYTRVSNEPTLFHPGLRIACVTASLCKAAMMATSPWKLLSWYDF